MEILVARLEATAEQISGCLDSIESCLARIESKIGCAPGSMVVRMDEAFSAIDRKASWVIGLLVAGILLRLMLQY